MSQGIDSSDLKEKLRLASDHFPVLLQLDETPL
jgi:endonuclease/exonuclease/phosphatase family metal-dependent hydrolase